MVAEETMIQDAWGNPFSLRREGTDVIIIAPGRDNAEGTTDDFRISLESNRRQVPPPLSAEELTASRRGQ
jgi:hypothetical protein